MTWGWGQQWGYDQNQTSTNGSSFLLKGENSVSIDGKCSDPTLLSNLLDEMKETLSKC